MKGVSDFSDFARDSGALARLDRTSFEATVMAHGRRPSRGWEGDEPERLLFDLASSALRKKSEKREGYRVLREYHPLHVVVYDRSYAPSVDARIFLDICKGSMPEFSGIDRAFLLMADGGRVLEILSG